MELYLLLSNYFSLEPLFLCNRMGILSGWNLRIISASFLLSSSLSCIVNPIIIIKRLILWWIRNCYHHHHPPTLLLIHRRLHPTHLPSRFHPWNLLHFWVYRLSILFSNYLSWTHALIKGPAKPNHPATHCSQTPPYPFLLSFSSASTTLFGPFGVFHFKFGYTFKAHFPNSQCSCTCLHKLDTGPPIIAKVSRTLPWTQVSLWSDFCIFSPPFQAMQISSSAFIINFSALAPCSRRTLSFPACFHFAVALFAERNFKYKLGHSRCLLHSFPPGRLELGFGWPLTPAILRLRRRALLPSRKFNSTEFYGISSLIFLLAN